MHTDTTIAKTIWSQLSVGTKMSIGARAPIAIDNGLIITVLKGKHRIKIVLNGLDLYDVTLLKTTIHGLHQLEHHADIYNDMLNEVVYHACNK